MTEGQRIKANELQKQIVDMEDLLKDINPNIFSIGETHQYRKSPHIAYTGTSIENTTYVRCRSGWDIQDKNLEKFVIDNSKECMTIAWALLKPRLETKLEALKKEFNEL